MSKGNKDDFSLLDKIEQKRNASAPNENLIYYVSGFLTSAVPIYFYSTLFNMSLKDYGPIFGIVTALATVVLSLAYQNVTQAISNRLISDLSPGRVGKDLNKKEVKEQREKIREMQELITHYKSMAFSLVYNNLFYLLLAVFFAFYILRSFGGLINYVLTVAAAVGLVYFSSAQTNKRA